ncbi:MAG: response regulator [Flavobacteriales bacterium]|nr:response regulator [Flavobacteriales bacterium]
MISPERLNILLVDDNDIDIAVNTKLLKLAELTDNIYSFNSGRQFIEFLDTNMNGLKKKVNVVLMDIMMPGMDGFQCLEKVKELPEDALRSIFAFMLTSSIDRNDIIKAEKSGIVRQVLEKPLDVYLVKKFLRDIYLQSQGSE